MREGPSEKRHGKAYRQEGGNMRFAAGRGYYSAPKPIEALDNSILMVEARNESSRFPSFDEGMHQASLKTIDMFFGRVMTSEELLDVMRNELGRNDRVAAE